MGGLAAWVAEARAALERPGPLAEDRIPNGPGLYAIHGGSPTWVELGLGEPPDDRPLYIGKAEDSLVSRILGTHLHDGRTGHSTLRRSLAALLHDAHGLRGIPRNPASPGYFSNYGLSEAHDSDLTGWMSEHLQLAVWVKPIGVPSLEQAERELLVEFQPPLNTRGVVTPWISQVKAARKVMAREAGAWAPERLERVARFR